MNIGINKTRIALLEVLKEMGADIKLSNVSNEYEPCADISIRASELKGITLNPKLVPNLIDELPVLFIAASLAEGQTIIRGAEELREKESDRLEAMANSLKLLGVRFKVYGDGIDIQGLNQEVNTSNSDMPFEASHINSFGDHRIAMTSAIACTRANDKSYIEDTKNVTTSFPNFLEICEEVGLDIK
jgi:3-phosphoshikimate 1-carboxyvinyltransferase